MTANHGSWGLSATGALGRRTVRHLLRTKTRGLCMAVIAETTTDTSAPICGRCADIEQAIAHRSRRTVRR